MSLFRTSFCPPPLCVFSSFSVWPPLPNLEGTSQFHDVINWLLPILQRPDLGKATGKQVFCCPDYLYAVAMGSLYRRFRIAQPDCLPSVWLAKIKQDNSQLHSNNGSVMNYLALLELYIVHKAPTAPIDKICKYLHPRWRR